MTSDPFSFDEEDEETGEVDQVLDNYHVFTALCEGNSVEREFNNLDEARTFHSTICRVKKRRWPQEIHNGLLSVTDRFSIRMQWFEDRKTARLSPVKTNKPPAVYRVFKFVEDQEGE